jgi:hypothetical protein
MNNNPGTGFRFFNSCSSRNRISTEFVDQTLLERIPVYIRTGLNGVFFLFVNLLTPVFFLAQTKPTESSAILMKKSCGARSVFCTSVRKYSRITLQLKLFTVYEPQKLSVTDQSSLNSIAVKKRNQTGDIIKLGVLKEVNS